LTRDVRPVLYADLEAVRARKGVVVKRVLVSSDAEDCIQGLLSGWLERELHVAVVVALVEQRASLYLYHRIGELGNIGDVRGSEVASERDHVVLGEVLVHLKATDHRRDNGLVGERITEAARCDLGGEDAQEFVRSSDTCDVAFGFLGPRAKIVVARDVLDLQVSGAHDLQCVIAIKQITTRVRDIES